MKTHTHSCSLLAKAGTFPVGEQVRADPLLTCVECYWDPEPELVSGRKTGHHRCRGTTRIPALESPFFAPGRMDRRRLPGKMNVPQRDQALRGTS